MPEQRQLQTNFTSGEISPKVHGRIEHERYQNGAAKLENIVVSPTGGAIKRNGTSPIGYLNASSYSVTGDAGYTGAPNTKVEGVRMIPFIFNRESSYVLAFVANDANDASVFVISNSTKDFHRFTSHDASNHPGNASITANDKVKVWDLDASSNNFDIPYKKTQLKDLDIAQVEDTIFITHPEHPVRKITRRNNTDSPAADTYWTIENVTFYDGPYNSLNSDETKAISLDLAVDRSYIKFTDSADMSGIATNDFVEFESDGDTIFGRVLSVDGSAQTAIVTAFDNVLKAIDTNVVIESDQGAIAQIGHDTNNHDSFLLSTSSVFSKTHEGAYYKHRQYDSDTSAVKNRWVQIDEYLGLRVVKPSSASPNTSPVLRTWAPSHAGGSGLLNQSHNNIPADGITADCVRIKEGSWRKPTGATTFYFENATPAGKIYQYDRIIYAKLTANSAIFNTSTDDGRFIRLDFNGKKVWGRLSTVAQATDDGVGAAFGGWSNSTTQYAVRLYVPLPLDPTGKGAIMDKGITTKWQLGAWYTGNYPKSCSFFQQRMVFGGSPNSPQTLWFSTIGDFETFAPTDIDSNVLPVSGFSYKISSSNVNEIIWLDSAENLIVGTSGSEWRVTSSSAGTAITPTNVKITQQTTFGSSDIRPQRVGDSIIFTQAPGKIVREMSYNYDTDSFRAINLSVLADHLFDVNSPVIECSYLKYPHNQIFFRTGSGDLYYMTYEKEQKVVAFSRWYLGGHSRKAIPAGTNNWGASADYEAFEQQIYDGILYECTVKHTGSTSFEVDYAEGKWRQMGPSVLAMCSLPSSTDLKSDSLFIATYRDGSERLSNTTVQGDGNTSICFEYVSPLGDFSVDTPHQPKLGQLVRGMDYVLESPSAISVGAGGTFNEVSFASSVISGDGYMPLPLSTSGDFIDVSLVLYGDSSHPYVYNYYPNSSLTCRLTLESGNYKIRAYNSSGVQQTLFTNPVVATTAVNWAMGFPFHGFIETLPIESSGGGGNSMGRVRRVNEVTLNLENSGEFKIGSSKMEQVLADESTFTGQVTQSLNSEYGNQSSLIMYSPYPTSMGVLSYSPEATINR